MELLNPLYMLLCLSLVLEMFQGINIRRIGSKTGKEMKNRLDNNLKNANKHATRKANGLGRRKSRVG